MRWNQQPHNSKIFGRRTCPICGANLIGGDDRSGAFDDEIKCPTDSNHYRNFYSYFGDWLTILGREFNDKQAIGEIEAYLDEVGNKEYKGE